MITPIENQLYTADTTRNAVLDARPARRRLTSMLNLLAEMDEAAVEQNFDNEVTSNFAPVAELTNFEKVELIITDPSMPKELEALLADLSEVQVAEPNSDYASYEIKA